MALQSSPRETATQTLQTVTRQRPQRMVTGPPLTRPADRLCASVDQVPRMLKASASMDQRENFSTMTWPCWTSWLWWESMVPPSLEAFVFVGERRSLPVIVAVPMAPGRCRLVRDHTAVLP